MPPSSAGADNETFDPSPPDAGTGTSTDASKDSEWSAESFTTPSPSSCSGNRFVGYNAKYQKFVGVVLCDVAGRYKLYMSETRDGEFLEIADNSGHGEDHCELVNPMFKITDDDDITSGGCSECAMGGNVDPIGVPVFAREKFGEPFERRIAVDWADLSTAWYACGVTIP